MIWLLDGNVLVAMAMEGHLHHERAHRWFATLGKGRFATCAITQGTLLRLHMKTAEDGSAAAAWATLEAVTAHRKHVWWGDDLSYQNVDPRTIQGGNQVTDAWLAELARTKKGKLATLDSGLASLHADVAVLLPL